MRLLTKVRQLEVIAARRWRPLGLTPEMVARSRRIIARRLADPARREQMLGLLHRAREQRLAQEQHAFRGSKGFR